MRARLLLVAIFSAALLLSGLVTGNPIRGQTLLQQGGAQQSMLLTYTYQAPANAFTITLTDGIGVLLINPAGTLAAGTIVMPPHPQDGQTFRLGSTQIITSLTMSPAAGQTLGGALAALAVSGFGSWIYRAGDSTWYRIG